MDLLKQQFQRIQEQLAALTGTQRMLVYSLVAVMVLTVLLWSRYAAAPEVVPLLAGNLSQQDIADIQLALSGRGIKSTVTGASISVSPDDRALALGILASENRVPQGATTALDEIMGRMTPWDSQDKNNWLKKQHLAMELRSAVLMTEGVRDARVFVDTSNQPRFGTPISPTASVWITTKSGNEKFARKKVQGIAALVMGTIGGIKQQDIKIVVDQRPYLLDAEGQGIGGGNDMLEVKAEWEKYYADKIVSQLNYIPGVIASVAIKLDIESKETRTQAVDDIKSKESEINTETMESSTANASGPSDPGVGANTSTPLSVAPPAQGNTQTSEKSVTKMEHFPTRREEHLVKHSGEGTPVGASVSIPRSWFSRQLLKADPNDPKAPPKEPDPAAVDAKIASELPGMIKAVQTATNLTDPNSVQINTYVDSMPELAGVVGSSGSAVLNLPFGAYLKEILIGALALVSLFMVSMIVRKSNPSPLVLPEPAQAPRREVSEIDGNEPLAGVAAVGNPTLDGMELGDEELKSQQMVDQVNNMVKENPDAAAQMVKRWLNRT